MTCPLYKPRKEEMKKLLDLYKAILPLAGLTTVKDGTVVMLSNGEVIELSNNPLVLPLKANLKTDNNKTIFHPMCEDLTMDASLILQAYSGFAASWLNYVIGSTLSEILEMVSVDVDETDVNSVVSLGKLPVLSKPTCSTIIKLLEEAVIGYKLADFRISNIDRSASLIYPIITDMDDIDNNNQPLSLYGVKFTKIAWEALKDILTLILTPITYKSVAKGAPFTHSVLTVLTKFYTSIEEWLKVTGSNDVIKMNSNVLKYMPIFDTKEIHLIINQVPPQHGNRGTVKNKAPTTAITAPAPMVQPKPIVPTGVIAATPVAASPVVAPVAAASPVVAPVAAASPLVTYPAAPVALPNAVIGAPPANIWGNTVAPTAAPAAVNWSTPTTPVTNTPPWLIPQV